jgi:hypothetical protein
MSSLPEAKKKLLKCSPLGQGDFRANSDLVLGQLKGDMTTQVSNLVVNLDVLLQEGFL